MPAAFPGNSTTKLARAATGGGFESAIEEVVSGTPAINSVTDNGDGTLTITGSNFGSKAQAAPKYWEMGSDMRVSGSSVTPVAVNSTTPDPALWGSYIIPEAGTEPEDTQGMRMVTSNPRHVGVDQHWRAFGKGELFDPLFMDSLSGSEGHKFYFAYRLYPGARFGWSVVYGSTEGQVGNFNIDNSRQVGEPCDLYDGATLLDSGKHQLIWISPTGVATISNLPGRSYGGSELLGKKLVGQESGAEITISASATISPPSSVKHMRAHQPPMRGPNTFYTSHSNVNGGAHLLDVIDSLGNRVPITGSNPTGIGHVGLYWGSWVLLELLGDFSDPQNCWDELRVNGQRLDFRQYDATTTFIDAPIKPANIGMDSPGVTPFTFADVGLGCDFGEMYFDNDPVRVMLTDAATLETSTKFEIQRPTDWANDTITVAKYEGELAGAPTQYLHVLRGFDYSSGAAV